MTMQLSIFTKRTIGIIMGAVLLTGTSCKKEFLDENLVTTKSLGSSRHRWD